MKKNLLLTGSAILMTGMTFTGCISPSDNADEYYRELAVFINEARAYENHEPCDEKYVLPNRLLTSSKEFYVGEAAITLDKINADFGNAEYIHVHKDLNDSAYNTQWNILRAPDDYDAESFASAENDLKEACKFSVDQNVKTMDKDYDLIFENVRNKKAADDVETPEISAEIKLSEEWIARGKAHHDAVEAAEAATKAAQAAKIAAAEKEANESKRQIELVLKYYTSYITQLIARATITGNPFLDKAAEMTIAEGQKLMDEAVTEWPGVVDVFDLDLDTTDFTSLAESLEKELEPYIYSLDIATDRLIYTSKAREWRGESKEAVDSAENEE